ncbi:MAG: zinc-ribbon domain, partial [Gaiellaceae bacterium]|nr:zinc-ribbon domain [Gaiellaceae bacterium]
MSHIYCPECGFQNPEAANYCSKCGAPLHTQESGETTQTFTAEEREELLEKLDDVGVKG